MRPPAAPHASVARRENGASNPTGAAGASSRKQSRCCAAGAGDRRQPIDVASSRLAPAAAAQPARAFITPPSARQLPNRQRPEPQSVSSTHDGRRSLGDAAAGDTAAAVDAGPARVARGGERPSRGIAIAHAAHADRRTASGSASRPCCRREIGREVHADALGRRRAAALAAEPSRVGGSRCDTGRRLSARADGRTAAVRAAPFAVVGHAWVALLAARCRCRRRRPSSARVPRSVARAMTDAAPAHGGRRASGTTRGTTRQSRRSSTRACEPMSAHMSPRSAARPGRPSPPAPAATSALRRRWRAEFA